MSRDGNVKSWRERGFDGTFGKDTMILLKWRCSLLVRPTLSCSWRYEILKEGRIRKEGARLLERAIFKSIFILSIVTETDCYD